MFLCDEIDAMIVSVGSPTDYPQAHPDRRASFITLHTNCVQAQVKPRLKKGSGGKNAATGSG
jgi:hypothetical protein